MLSVRDRMTLTVADELRGPWLQREGRIRWLFSEPPTHFWARVGRLLDDPDAAAEMPQVVHRLRRLREARRAVRRAG